MMGAQLVSRVYTSWTHLPDRPFRLLAYMALVTKDTNADPTYWGGREALAEAMGMTPGTESSRQMIKRAVRDLIDSGAIERAYIGHAGKRTEYRLTLTPRKPKKGERIVTPEGVNSVTPEGERIVTGRGNESYPKGGTHSSPLGTKRNQEGKQEEPISSPNSSVGAAMGRVARARNSRLELVRERIDGQGVTA